MKTRRGVDFILSPVYVFFLLFERVFSAFLYGAKSTRGFETPLCLQTDASFCLYFPLHRFPLFPGFPLQSSCLPSCREMLLKML